MNIANVWLIANRTTQNKQIRCCPYPIQRTICQWTWVIYYIIAQYNSTPFSYHSYPDVQKKIQPTRFKSDNFASFPIQFLKYIHIALSHGFPPHPTRICLFSPSSRAFSFGIVFGRYWNDSITPAVWDRLFVSLLFDWPFAIVRSKDHISLFISRKAKTRGKKKQANRTDGWGWDGRMAVVVGGIKADWTFCSKNGHKNKSKQMNTSTRGGLRSVFVWQGTD